MTTTTTTNRVSVKRYIPRVNRFKGQPIIEYYHSDWQVLSDFIAEVGVDLSKVPPAGMEICLYAEGKFTTHLGAGDMGRKHELQRQRSERRISEWIARVGDRASGWCVRILIAAFAEPIAEPEPIVEPIVEPEIAVPTHNISPEARERAVELSLMPKAELVELWGRLLNEPAPKGLNKEQLYSCLWVRLYLNK